MDADGCVSAGVPLWWRGACVGFSLNRSVTSMLPPDAVREAVEDAFRAWSDVDCGGGARASMSFGALPDTACARAAYDANGPNVNVVVFRDDDWLYKGADNTVARAHVHFDPSTGEILDVDIEVNTANNRFTLGGERVIHDLRTVLTHEIGHLLGLAHSPDPGAVMFADYAMGTTEGRSLGADDVAAMCAIFPPDRPATCEVTPRGGLDLCTGDVVAGCSSSGAAARGSIWCWVVALAALTVLTWTRLRREVP